MGLISGQFNDAYEPVSDGVVTVVKNYAYWLTCKYGESYVVTPKHPKYIDSEAFEVLRYLSVPMPKREPYRVGLPGIDFKFQYKVKKIDFDIIHAHSPFSAGRMALQTAKKLNVPVVATFHSKFYDDFKQVLKNDILARVSLDIVMDFFEQCDYVWTVNKRTFQTMREYGFKGEVMVVENGTDLPPVSDDEKIRLIETINSEMHIGANETVLLFVGQHIYQKNLQLLIQSMLELKQLDRKFKLIMVGDGAARKELMEMSHKLKLTKNIRFVGNIKDRDRLRGLYARASLLVFPSIYDNAPLVVREAAAAGCPSLLIKYSNAAEGISDNENGFLCREDASDIANTINSILLNPENIRRVGDNAKKTLARSWENIIDDVHDLYIDILKDFRYRENHMHKKSGHNALISYQTATGKEFIADKGYHKSRK